MNNTNYSKIRPRRGTASQWHLFNPVLAEGEIGIEYPDTGLGTGLIKIKIGDGSTPWDDLEYGVNPTVANAIYGGTPVSSNDICIRSGTYEEWINFDPVLGDGEIVFDRSNNSIIVGDGSHKFSELSYIKSSGTTSGVLNFDFGDEDKII